MDWKQVIFTATYFIVLSILIHRFQFLQFNSFKPFVSLFVFYLKFFAGIGIWWVYTFYYTEVQHNDVHKFYNNALVLHDAATESPGVFLDLMMYNESNKFEKDEYRYYTNRMKNWNRNFDEAPFNENRTIIRINALLMFLSQRVYWVHILFFSFVAFIGIVLLTNSVFSFIDIKNSFLAMPVLLLPSVLFWTSGVMKEPILMLGIGLCLSAAITPQRLLLRALKFIFGMVLILLTKFFVLACLLPSLAAYLFYRKRGNMLFVFTKHVSVFAVMIVLVLMTAFLVPSFRPVQMLINKQTHAIREAEYFKAGSRIEIPELSHDVFSFVKASFNGIWNSLARPYLWETNNGMILLSALETVFAILFLILCLFYSNLKNFKNFNLFLLLLGSSLVYFALVGMSTPVLGNLVRYKVLFLPLLMYSMVLLVGKNNLSNKFNFLLREK